MKTIIKKLSVIALAAGVAASAWAGNITVKGSDTLVILAQKWAETYMGLHTNVNIQVTGGGTGAERLWATGGSADAGAGAWAGASPRRLSSARSASPPPMTA